MPMNVTLPNTWCLGEEMILTHRIQRAISLLALLSNFCQPTIGIYFAFDFGSLVTIWWEVRQKIAGNYISLKV